VNDNAAFDPRGVWTVVVAAGTGTRYGSDLPKQFTTVAGRRVIDWSVAAACGASEGVVVVLPAEYYDEIAPTLTATECVRGGATRSESVRAGLASVPDTATTVLVHDAARPFADRAVFGRVIAAVRSGAEAVVPVAPVVDTMRHLDGLTIDRDKLQIVQTPQGFDAAALRRVHASAAEATDDASLIEQAGGAVATVDGHRWNIKLTTTDDAGVLEALLEARSAS